MAQCDNRYLSLCSIPARASRDGYASEFANIYLPFCGIYFFSGATFTDPGARVPQDTKRFIGGTSGPGIFKKEGAWCGEGI